MKHSKKYGITYKLMQRLIDMVDKGSISKENPLVDYEGMKRELEKTDKNNLDH